MKKNYFLIVLFLLFSYNIFADEIPKDTLRVIDVEEVIVIATPKENRKLREQPTAVTLLSQQDMQANQITSIKNLTGIVPNMFIPDYGSRLTSAIYIRGIGSRINTPSVGLYVDNVPYIDKSAFDFNYADIERIDILRGPQGTLYGRNTMAGLIRVHTKSPFSYQGTDIRLSAATHNQYSGSLTHYHRISDKFAFSAGGFYGYSGGFFKNSAHNNEKIDDLNEAGGRIRAIYFPTENIKVDLNVNYEYSDQGGYPYYYVGRVGSVEEDRPSYIGKISINDESNYRRNLLNTGLNIEYQSQDFILSAVTGYQHMKDRMFLDQDFTEQDIFNIEQKQRLNTLSEEIVFKSKPNKKWQWATGAFGFYQWLKTSAPVTFKRQGIESMIENNVNNIFAGIPIPQMKIKINNDQLLVNDDFDTPTLNGAIYHQSTFNNILINGLSFTAGLRLDYEKNAIKYDSNSYIEYDFNIHIPSMRPGMQPQDIPITEIEAPASLIGKLNHDYFQLLPKFALQYEWKKNNSIYSTVSRGYRSGGYNVQMFSDLVRTELQNSMIKALMNREEIPANMLPIIEEKIGDKIKLIDVKGESIYQPEYTWNYEIGSHITAWDGRLLADLSAFYMDTRDQQISHFVESGAGRITVNAGKSRSFGAEAALRLTMTNALTFNASYGYTNAKFKYYKMIDDNNEEINYKGNYVPFTPMHTFNMGGQYVFIMAPNSWLDQIQIDANYNGAARIYWTEQNNVRQPFYGTLNARLSFVKGNGQIALWGRNLLDKEYGTFYFESMKNGFMQKGRPIQLGIDIRCRF